MRVGSPCMNDKELYARILGIERPWIVSEVKLDMKAREVVVCVAVDPGDAPALRDLWEGGAGLRLASTPLAAPRHVPAAHDPRSRRSSS